MKIPSRILSLLILAAATAFFAGCNDKDDDEKTEEEIQFDKLKGVWAVTSVTNDGTDRSGEWEGVNLTIAGNFVPGGTYNYSFTGTMPNPSPWPRSGVFRFGTDVSSTLVRDSQQDEITMQYAVSDNVLEITFELDPSGTGWDPGSGRIKSVTGNWQFIFEKL